jgi:hypothetical protein
LIPGEGRFVMMPVWSRDLVSVSDGVRDLFDVELGNCLLVLRGEEGNDRGNDFCCVFFGGKNTLCPVNCVFGLYLGLCPVLASAWMLSKADFL